MNAMQKALSEIYFTIPVEVLNLGFKENNDKLNKIIGLDERITSSVIRPRVMVDANLCGGVPMRINTLDCKVTHLPTNEYIVEVPKTLTDNRSIICCLSLVAILGAPTSLFAVGTNPVIASTNVMYNSLSNESVIQTSRLELIGENIIMVQDPSISIFNCVIRVMVEHDNNMGTLQPGFIPSFAKLCVLAVKSYLYNTLKVKLNQGFVYGGHELSSITDIIEGYADAEDQYQEYIQETYGAISYMNSNDNMWRLIKSQMGNNV